MVVEIIALLIDISKFKMERVIICAKLTHIYHYRFQDRGRDSLIKII